MQKPSTISTRNLLRVGLTANALESYEFSLYNFLAPIIGQLFLEPTDSQTLYIRSYLLVCCGFISRPLGSILWGYCADHIGRGRTLKISILLMSVCTALMGVLPTYSQIGGWATISFLLLRFMQGFSKGGDYSISGCYIYESSNPEKRSLLCGIVGASAVLGMLGGSCVTTLLFWYFDEVALRAWAWRLPYLLGIPITFWMVRIRKSIRELREQEPFPTAQPSGVSTPQETLSFLLTLAPLVLVIGFMEVCSYTVFVWLPSYMNHFLGIDASLAQLCNTVGFSAWVGFIILSGYLSSIFGYRRMMVVHTVATIILAIPLFKLLQVGTYPALLLAYIVFAWLQSGIPAVMMEMLGDAFPRKVRALGMGLGHNLAATLFGSTAPLVNSLVIQHTGLSIFPAIYITTLGVVVLFILLFFNSRRQIALN